MPAATDDGGVGKGWETGQVGGGTGNGGGGPSKCDGKEFWLPV